MPDSLNLTIQVPADEWSYTKRRLTYLEALLVRAVRERGEAEWYTADDLARLRLPGLPMTAGAITRRATLGFWKSRRVRDRDGRQRTVYHVASLPARTFDSIVSRVLDTDGQPSETGRPLPALPAAPPIPAKLPANAAPPWVLPLMRIMRTEAEGDLAKAWAALPERLPPGCAMPSVEDAADVLVRFGVIRTG